MRRSVENAECVGLFRRLHRSRLYTGYPFVCPSVNANNHDVITYPVRAERGNIQTHRPGGHGRHNREASVGHDAYNVQIGLFAPRHGQQYRDDQRRRRSQYDRGTTAAENEARYEGLFDPARVAHPGLDPRSVGTARFGGGMLLPYQ